MFSLKSGVARLFQFSSQHKNILKEILKAPCADFLWLQNGDLLLWQFW